mmetsp:Transcript_18348/g.41787  ORF Transcript_18348/g.41787 Transcript_18348/m.41787 type:complete len:200 (-) Transcript_18348:152-751(-)
MPPSSVKALWWRRGNVPCKRRRRGGEASPADVSSRETWTLTSRPALQCRTMLLRKRTLTTDTSSKCVITSPGCRPVNSCSSCSSFPSLVSRRFASARRNFLKFLLLASVASEFNELVEFYAHEEILAGFNLILLPPWEARPLSRTVVGLLSLVRASLLLSLLPLLVRPVHLQTVPCIFRVLSHPLLAARSYNERSNRSS